MIEEDYVSFETAKLLKEKGFDDNCAALYDLRNGKLEQRGVGYVFNNGQWINFITAPTLQMAMKWLRAEHNKIIIPGIRATDPITGIIDCYYVGIHYIPKNNGGALCYTSPTPENGYSSYEEACEAGIKYCLENLI